MMDDLKRIFRYSFILNLIGELRSLRGRIKTSLPFCLFCLFVITNSIITAFLFDTVKISRHLDNFYIATLTIIGIIFACAVFASSAFYDDTKDEEHIDIKNRRRIHSDRDKVLKMINHCTKVELEDIDLENLMRGYAAIILWTEKDYIKLKRWAKTIQTEENTAVVERALNGIVYDYRYGSIELKITDINMMKDIFSRNKLINKGEDIIDFEISYAFKDDRLINGLDRIIRYFLWSLFFAAMFFVIREIFALYGINNSIPYRVLLFFSLLSLSACLYLIYMYIVSFSYIIRNRGRYQNSSNDIKLNLDGEYCPEDRSEDCY